MWSPCVISGIYYRPHCTGTVYRVVSTETVQVELNALLYPHKCSAHCSCRLLNSMEVSGREMQMQSDQLNLLRKLDNRSYGPVISSVSLDYSSQLQQECSA